MRFLTSLINKNIEIRHKRRTVVILNILAVATILAFITFCFFPAVGPNHRTYMQNVRDGLLIQAGLYGVVVVAGALMLAINWLLQ